MAKSPKSKYGFVAVTSHSETHDKHVAHRPTYDECVDVVHNFFLSYGFEIKDGRPFDGGNDDGEGGGFNCFDDVKMHKGKVAKFMHCDGEGPVGSVEKSE